MKINHLNLTATDVPATVAFLEKYFGLKSQGGDDKFAALFDDNALVLTLMKSHRVAYPRTFHIGFGQESKAQVNDIYERLKADGFDVNAPEQHHAWTFYVTAPGGFQIEIMA